MDIKENLNDLGADATIAIGYGMIDTIALMTRDKRLGVLSFKIKTLINDCRSLEKKKLIETQEYKDKNELLQILVRDYQKVVSMMPTEVIEKIKKRFSFKKK